MGLLDEAIREHLELKRRRGGDPTEIAREEQEALAPVFGEPGGPAAEEPPDGESEPLGVPELAQDQQEDAFSSVGQETAELDMQTVLGGEEMLTEEHAAPLAPEAEPEEEFEWDAPPSNGEAPPEIDPGQERLSFE